MRPSTGIQYCWLVSFGWQRSSAASQKFFLEFCDICHFSLLSFVNSPADTHAKSELNVVPRSSASFFAESQVRGNADRHGNGIAASEESPHIGGVGVALDEIDVFTGHHSSYVCNTKYFTLRLRHHCPGYGTGGPDAASENISFPLRNPSKNSIRSQRHFSS